MNKISIVLITSLVLGVLGIQKVNAQLTTDPTVAPADAVELLLGQGVTIQNLEFSGQASQVGSFDCAGCGLGIATGLVMATGSVDVAEGPNNEGGAEGGFGSDGVSDPDLDVIATEGLNNAVVLEFDFIATGDSVEFEYIFASEEYPEFVNAGFNDVFGFFLSGPGIAGGQGFEDDAENIALIPGTSTPVSIDNVNDGLNQEFYVPNNNGEFPDVQFDGFTTNLIAQKGNLLCDSTYHIKLAIADAGDGSWDSGVFLAANSFTSSQLSLIGSANMNSTSLLGDSVLVESCNQASFSLVRPSSDGEETITLEISGTAENGVDIVPAIPTDLVFADGENTINLPPFSAVEDGMAEGIEFITLSISAINACGSQYTIEQTIYIQDYVNPSLQSGQYILPCPGSTITIGVGAQGIEPFTYLWSTTEQGSSIEVSPIEDTTYSVQATDACGSTISIPVPVTISDTLPELILEPQNDIEVTCPGDFVQLFSEVISGSPPYDYFWSTGDNTAQIIVSPSTTTTYVVSVEDACSQMTQDSVVVIVPESETLNVTIEQISCNEEPLSMAATPTGGFPTYTYSWSPVFGFSSTLTPNPSPTTATQYSVVVTDFCGQQETASFFYDPDQIDTLLINGSSAEIVGQSSSYTCDLTEGSTYQWTVIGGVITSGQGTNEIIVEWTDEGQGVITLIETNQSGCESDPLVFEVSVSCQTTADDIEGPLAPPELTEVVYTCNGSNESSYTWDISNGVVASGQGTNEVTVVWASTGLGNISVIETTAEQCDGDTIILEIVTVISVDESFLKDIKLYPNPTNGRITIAEMPSRDSYIIFSMNGERVDEGFLFKGENVLDLENLKAGVYFIYIESLQKAIRLSKL